MEVGPPRLASSFDSSYPRQGPAYARLPPLELIGSIWWGAATTGTAVIVAGLLTHVAVAMVLGLVYSYAFPFAKVEPVVQGLVFGAIVWFVAQILVLPQVATYVSDGFAVWMFLAAHLLFGASLGFFEDLADRRWARRGVTR
ncbi:MAG: hypothetical protein ACYC5Q_02390 [Thermoleophilia bacterium]